MSAMPTGSGATGRAWRRSAVWALAAAAAGLTVFALALVALDSTAAYRSPLGGAAASDPPRMDALRTLEAWKAHKVAEEVRLAELIRTLDTPKLVGWGHDIVHGPGLCFNCHRVGSEGQGTQGPDLAGVGARAATRVPGMSDLEYLAQSVYQPGAFVVPNYALFMTRVDETPFELSPLEIRAVVAYLQSLGGTPTVKPDTTLPFAPQE